MAKSDYDTTLARIAGNISAGMVHFSQPNFDEEVARRSVLIARKIVAEIKRGDVEEQNAGERGDYLRSRCYACGHALRFASNGCPQCNEYFDGRKDPDVWPKLCSCARCNP